MIYFIVSGENDQLKNMQVLIQNSALNACYDFVNIDGLPEYLSKNKYESLVSLGKREFIVQPTLPVQDDSMFEGYYRVADWEMNADARLYNMFLLLQGLNEPVAFRIDIFPFDLSNKLENALKIKDIKDRFNAQYANPMLGSASNKDEKNFGNIEILC